MQEIALDFILGETIPEAYESLKKSHNLIARAESFNNFYRGKVSPINTRRMYKALRHAESLVNNTYQMQMFNMTNI